VSIDIDFDAKKNFKNVIISPVTGWRFHCLIIQLIDAFTLTFSVVAAFLLVLGLPLVKNLNTGKNLARHGALTIVALVLQTILIAVVMIPSLIQNFDVIVGLATLPSFNMWLHVGLGVFSLVSGFAYAGLWLVFYSSGMRCERAKKYMILTMIA